MDTLDGIRAFIAVVRTGSFTAAAERLHISKALTSKYVAQLEAHLGARLLNRTTRSLSLTEIGEVYFERSTQLLEEFEELEAIAHDRGPRPSGRLLMTAPTTFGEMYLAPAIADFHVEEPAVAVELTLTDRYVNLVEEGYDLAVRIGELTDSSLVARRLAPARIVTCASPEYLRRHGTPASPRELVEHACIVDTNFHGGHHWPYLVGEQRVNITVSGRLRVNNARAARQMVLGDAGIALCPAFAVSQDIIEGTICSILEGYTALKPSVSIVFPQNRHLASKVRAFVDFMVGYFDRSSTWDLF